MRTPRAADSGARRRRAYRLGLVFAAAVFAGALAAAAQGDPGEQAKRACFEQLGRQLGDEAGGLMPDAGFAGSQIQVRRSANTELLVTGSAWYRRDRLERGRPYEFRCSFDLPSGAATASHRWTGPFEPGAASAWPRQGEGGRVPLPSGRRVASGGVISVGSGKGLDVSGGSKEDAAEVIQYTFRGLPNQLWDVIDTGSGSYVLVSQKSSKVLGVVGGADGASVQQFRYKGGDGELWRIERLASGTGENGATFRIVNVASGKCLDVDGGRKDDGAGLIQFKCIDRPNQAWRLGE